MAARLRWRGWLLLIATTLLVSACSSACPSHPISGATATAGAVTVTTNASTYSINDAIGVIVTNNSKSDFYTQKGKSGCAIVQLEQYSATTGQWTRLDGCNGAAPTQTLVISAGSSVPFTLAPTSSADQNAWQPGTYRLSISYTTQSDGISGSEVAHSASFKVKG